MFCALSLHITLLISIYFMVFDYIGISSGLSLNLDDTLLVTTFCSLQGNLVNSGKTEDIEMDCIFSTVPHHDPT